MRMADGSKHLSNGSLVQVTGSGVSVCVFASFDDRSLGVLVQVFECLGRNAPCG